MKALGPIALFLILVVGPRVAAACGCFAAPNPAVPVVQAGEKILFAQEGNRVVAHIQIQYEGDAADFSWLIPLPAIPEYRLGAEEVFTELENATNPVFLLQQGFQACEDGGFALGCGDVSDSAAANESAAPPPRVPNPVLVEASSAGPYDFAVLDASSKGPMLEWLRANGYVVPAGGEGLLDPYIHDGAYFLALKLSSGETTGDLVPIVIEYDADVPMIPLELTRLGANPDMGVLVWILGQNRAVPTNYRHVQINEEYVDWVNQAENYAEVVARAVDEAEDGHAFVTEYAGTSQPMVGVLDPPGRFGRRDVFEGLVDAIEYIQELEAQSFPMTALRPTLEDTFPMPQAAVGDGLEPDDYYRDLASSLSIYDPTPAGFDPEVLTAELWERFVEPTIAAGALFRRHGYMTRLYTAISPDEMTADPAFAFNPDLPDVSNQHFATMRSLCDPEDEKYSWEMTLNDGRRYYFSSPDAWSTRNTQSAPRTATIERMGWEGQPTVETDNRETLQTLSGLPDAGGCISARPHRFARAFNMGLLFLIVFVGWRRWRR